MQYGAAANCPFPALWPSLLLLAFHLHLPLLQMLLQQAAISSWMGQWEPSRHPPLLRQNQPPASDLSPPSQPQFLQARFYLRSCHLPSLKLEVPSDKLNMSIDGSCIKPGHCGKEVLKTSWMREHRQRSQMSKLLMTESLIHHIGKKKKKKCL